MKEQTSLTGKELEVMCNKSGLKSLKGFGNFLVVLSVLSAFFGIAIGAITEEWIWAGIGLGGTVIFLIWRFILLALTIQAETALYVKAKIEKEYDVTEIH